MCMHMHVLNKLVSSKKFLVFYEILIKVILKTATILLNERMINETTRIKAESLSVKVKSYRRYIVSIRIETILEF